MHPFSIALFATSGDPEGIRHLDKSNWSGYGVVFNKELFHPLKQKPGFSQAGIYILVGNAAEETIYIGEADPVDDRLRIVPIPRPENSEVNMQSSRYALREKLAKNLDRSGHKYRGGSERRNLASAKLLFRGCPRFRDPRLQRPQLLCVLVAGLVGGDGSGDGRERNACGGRISISSGLGQLTGGGSVVQAHKAEVDSASSVGLNGDIDRNLLDDGFALLSDDADAVDVLGDDLDGGLRLPLADGGGLQGLLLDGASHCA